jgi:hypothetical protein
MASTPSRGIRLRVIHIQLLGLRVQQAQPTTVLPLAFWNPGDHVRSLIGHVRRPCHQSAYIYGLQSCILVVVYFSLFRNCALATVTLHCTFPAQVYKFYIAALIFMQLLFIRCSLFYSIYMRACIHEHYSRYQQRCTCCNYIFFSCFADLAFTRLLFRLA